MKQWLEDVKLGTDTPWETKLPLWSAIGVSRHFVYTDLSFIKMHAKTMHIESGFHATSFPFPSVIPCSGNFLLQAPAQETFAQ